MARGTKEQKQTPEVSADFPYRAWMTHPAWAIVDNALAELEDNDDLELRTARRYVIGYLLQQLAAQGLVPPADGPMGAKFRGVLKAILNERGEHASERPKKTKAAIR